MGAVSLVRGQRSKLAALVGGEGAFECTLRVVGPPPARVRAVLLAVDAHAHVLGGDAVVFGARPQQLSGAIRARPAHTGTDYLATFEVDPQRIPADADRLMLVLGFLNDRSGATDVQAVSHAELRLSSKAGSGDGAVYSFRGADYGHETALILGELYRKDGWRFRVPGNGFVGGFKVMMSQYKARNGMADAIERDEDLQGGIVLPPPPPEDPDHAPLSGPLTLPVDWPGGVVPKGARGMRPAVGFILVNGKDGTVSSGTGFVITPGGHVVTCAHVIEGAREAVIALGNSREARPLIPIARDDNHDLALMWIADRLGSAHWLQLASPDHEPDLGDKIGLLGYPLGGALGLDVTYSEGIVNSVRKSVGPRRRDALQIDAGAAPGSSGGPVFRLDDHRVVGMLTSGIDEHRGGMLLNFAADLRQLWKLGWVKSAA